ncbi:MAG: hypothetical protein IPK63_16980 [Candidatus Competibacteraceae bacterium]|nr:hypothetical protein [Candidatus Competibacteraceae bacterium]
MRVMNRASRDQVDNFVRHLLNSRRLVDARDGDLLPPDTNPATALTRWSKGSVLRLAESFPNPDRVAADFDNVFSALDFGGRQELLRGFRRDIFLNTADSAQLRTSLMIYTRSLLRAERFMYEDLRIVDPNSNPSEILQKWFRGDVIWCSA